MPQSKLVVIARRLIQGLNKICCDFVTCRHQAGLPLFDQKRRRLANLASLSNGNEVSMIGKASWQKLGHSTCPSRGASDQHLGSGVPYAFLHGVEKTPESSAPTRFTDTQGSFAITWRRRRLVLEMLERVGISHLCGQQLLVPHLLGVWGGLGNSANVLDVKVSPRRVGVHH
jgi:hypothetical protein